MSYYDYDFDYDDNPYTQILMSEDPKNIINISMLRHYLNVHGMTKILVEYSSLNKKQILKLSDKAPGYIKFEDAIDDYDTVIKNALEDEKKHKEAIKKNNELISQLADKRLDLCGIGTRRIKLLLNKLAKNGDNIAKAYRLILEAEDKNITAKNTDLYYREKVYAVKHKLIVELIEHCIENGFEYGVQDSQERNTNSIVYFDLPGMEQISFHTTFFEPHNYKTYNKEWDGEVNSTLRKIETAINNRYCEELSKQKK